MKKKITRKWPVSNYEHIFFQMTRPLKVNLHRHIHTLVTVRYPLRVEHLVAVRCREGRSNPLPAQVPPPDRSCTQDATLQPAAAGTSDPQLHRTLLVAQNAARKKETKLTIHQVTDCQFSQWSSICQKNIDSTVLNVLWTVLRTASDAVQWPVTLQRLPRRTTTLLVRFLLAKQPTPQRSVTFVHSTRVNTSLQQSTSVQWRQEIHNQS